MVDSILYDRVIPLTQGQSAIVDAADYDWITEWKWFAWWSPRASKYYACHTQGRDRNRIYMHRMLLAVPETIQVDHWDSDGLNNRRKNLRICTNQQNSWNQRLRRNNSSGYKGVSWHKGAQKWGARIMVSGVEHWLGLYDDPQTAARMYDMAALKYFGQFARLNFPEVAL